MAGKITELAAMTAANTAVGDLLEICDISDTSMAATGTNKRLSVAELAVLTGATRMGCSLTQSGQVYSTGAANDLAWNAEVADPDGFHVPGAADLFVPANGAGIYVLSVTANANPATTAVCDLAIMVAGVSKPVYWPIGKVAMVNTLVQPMSAGTGFKVIIYNGTNASVTFSATFDVYRFSL